MRRPLIRNAQDTVGTSSRPTARRPQRLAKTNDDQEERNAPVVRQQRNCFRHRIKLLAWPSSGNLPDTVAEDDSVLNGNDERIARTLFVELLTCTENTCPFFKLKMKQNDESAVEIIQLC